MAASQETQGALKPKGNPLEKYRFPALFGAIIVAAIVFLLPMGLGHNAKITLAAFAFTIVMWIFEVLPAGITAVLFAILLTILIPSDVMGTKVTFSGFTNDTFWLILGAFLIGEATNRTGFAERIALTTMKKGGSNYIKLLISLWIAQIILGALVPSGTVRTVMFIPIMVGIVNAYKAPANSNLAAGVLMHVYWASIVGSTLWYTGTNMNPTAMGIAKAATGYAPSYITWFIWMIIPSILLTVGCFFIIQKVFPPEKEYLANEGGVTVVEDRLKAMGEIKPEEKRAGIYFLICIALWITEPLHGIATAWVALGMATLLFLPKVGVLKGAKALGNISWDTLLLLGVALGITKIISAVGLDEWITKLLLAPILDPLAAFGPIGLVFGICIITALIHLLMASASAETSMLAPLMIKYATGAGFNATLAGMAVARTAQNVFIFPFQTTPLVAVWGTGFIDMPKCIKVMLWIGLFNIVWITVMGPYWNWIMNVIK